MLKISSMKETFFTVDRLAPEKLADVLGRDVVLRLRLFTRFHKF